jgi:hypothetical protein
MNKIKTYQVKGQAFRTLNLAKAGRLRSLDSWPEGPKHFRLEWTDGGPHLEPGYIVKTYNPHGALLPGQWVSLSLFKKLIEEQKGDE